MINFCCSVFALSTLVVNEKTFESSKSKFYPILMSSLLKQGLLLVLIESNLQFFRLLLIQ